MTYPKIILASASPRRRELLALISPDFDVLVSGIDETALPNEAPQTFAERMATEKAAALELPPDTLIIAADTVVTIHEQILGKPESAQAAIDMLTLLSDKSHHVITGVCIRTPVNFRTFSVSTEVTFRALAPSEIEAYVSTGCPMDKAGAYGIQGGAAPFVRSIHGSYTNVVGLPLCELSEALSHYQ